MTTAFVPHSIYRREASTGNAASTCPSSTTDGAAKSQSAGDDIDQIKPAADNTQQTVAVKATVLRPAGFKPQFDLGYSGSSRSESVKPRRIMSRTGSESEGSQGATGGGLDSEVDPLLTAGDGESRSSKESEPELRAMASGVEYRPRSDAFHSQSERLQENREEQDIAVFELQAPIKGFEVMEARAKFTVYKIHVQRGPEESWFVFRRYTDFVRINRQLSKLFPGFRLALPPKRWFRDNYDVNFLEDRMLGLQAFINNILGHREMSQSAPVREFFCMDDPPGPHDSLEESRTMCENIQDELYNLHKDVQERDVEIDLLHDELDICRSKIETLEKELRREREKNRRRTVSPTSMRESMLSLAECDRNSCTEVDQEECDTKATKDNSRFPTPAELGDIPELEKKLESVTMSLVPNDTDKKIQDTEHTAGVSYHSQTKRKPLKSEDTGSLVKHEVLFS
ncbi:sorting nexin-16-like isoform X2 [Lingula anatina]|uniref:Sorting nexin-16 n=1 Tax=Lingula anatina TaxID=7574 RepID=A0A1S3HBT9_LINAN|nr:sorting nexin-16-like isoform X2 [Lingula anatina]|eukprot:XP_013382976.1 sorting nexin-16-like isoform X2 [Lingula anatina]